MTLRYAIIVAGGRGTRMGTDVPKQFLPLGGRPVLMRTLERFHAFDAQMELIVVLPAEQQGYWRALCSQYGFTLPHKLATGGATRFESSRNGLALVPDATGALVAIHDGARPFVSVETIGRCFAKAAETGAAIPVIPVTDTLRQTTGAGRSLTVDRSLYQRVQTPQVFDVHLLKAAYAQPYRPEYTDDASVYEFSGGRGVSLVEGNVENIKLTTPFDLLIGEALICQKHSE